MKMSTTHVLPHEIAKAEDFEFGFQSLIRNLSMMEREIITNIAVDTVTGGKVRPVTGTMDVTIDSIWGNSRDLDLPVHSDQISEPVAVPVPDLLPRIDTLEARGVFEAYDVQRRAFYEPDLEAAEYHNVPTKNKLCIELILKQGIEGGVSAPDTDEGYIKIAEIHSEPGMQEILSDNIKNVTATDEGEENEEWTNEKTRTVLIDRKYNIIRAFLKEHLENGVHRPRVIHASNIATGEEDDDVNGKTISIGDSFTVRENEVSQTTSLYNALKIIAEALMPEAPSDEHTYGRKEGEWERIIGGNEVDGEDITIGAPIEVEGTEVPGNTSIYDALQTIINALMPEAPEDGFTYGRKDREWEKIIGGGGGIGIYAFQIEGEDLYVYYDDEDSPPSLYINRDETDEYGCLIWEQTE